MKARNFLLILVLCALAIWGGKTLLKPTKTSTILLSNATAAPLIGQADQLAVFVSITNSGPYDQLLSAHAPDATATTFSETHGVRAIPANSAASLAADGVFIKLSGITGALKDGRTFPISLTFANAGPVTTRARLITPKEEGAASTFGLFGIGDICQVGEGEPAPKIALTTARTDVGWTVTVVSDDFEFAPDLVDGPHVPGTGHGHIYINGLKLGRLYSPTTTIGNLPPGQHEIRVTLSTNDHRVYVANDIPVTASATLNSQ